MVPKRLMYQGKTKTLLIFLLSNVKKFHLHQAFFKKKLNLSVFLLVRGYRKVLGKNSDLDT